MHGALQVNGWVARREGPRWGERKPAGFAGERSWQLGLVGWPILGQTSWPASGLGFTAVGAQKWAPNG